MSGSCRDCAHEACAWTQSDPDFYYWGTTCGHAFELTAGIPSEHGMAFCCFCGKPLVEVPYVALEDDDDD